MGEIQIFIFGCVVFGIVVASTFIYVIASDNPADSSEKDEPQGPSPLVEALQADLYSRLYVRPRSRSLGRCTAP